MISLKSKRELALMRKASKIVHSVLEELEKRIAPGITTLELDRIAAELIGKEKARASFKNYHGYPANICASVNDEVVHGIPSKRKLNEGDIVSVDVGVCYDGYHADAARTWGVGSISTEASELIEVTRESFFKGIEAIKAGSRLGDLSNTIQRHVEANKYAVVRDFVGHGIGSELHEEPQIPNFGEAHSGPILEEGMTLAIEPMVNRGTWKVRVLDNKWTVVTQDGALSAHYENTVVVTKEGVEVLT